MVNLALKISPAIYNYRAVTMVVNSPNTTSSSVEAAGITLPRVKKEKKQSYNE